jgi:futalosine hydrolase
MAGHAFSICTRRGLELLIGTTGVGKVNAAAVAAAALSIFRAGEVWNVGCAGAYCGSGLEIGDVLVTENCICADEGILGEEGPMPASSLGIPLVVRNGQPFYDCFPLGDFLSRTQVRALLPPGTYGPDSSGGIRPCEPRDSQPGDIDPAGDAAKRCGFRVQYGPSLTVGMVSGDVQTADARFRRFGALAENMEGSAIAQTCLLFDVPFLEFRGISNMAGVRDKARWVLDAATEHCTAVIIHLLDKSRES